MGTHEGQESTSSMKGMLCMQHAAHVDFYYNVQALYFPVSPQS